MGPNAHLSGLMLKCHYKAKHLLSAHLGDLLKHDSKSYSMSLFFRRFHPSADEFRILIQYLPARLVEVP